MKSSVLGIPLVAWVVTVLVCGTLGREDRDDQQSIKELKEEVGVLRNEVKWLKIDMRKLKGEGSSEAGDQDPFQIVSASRRLEANGMVTFTVRYKDDKRSHSYAPLWVDAHCHCAIHETIPDKAPALPPNVFESQVTIPARNDSSVRFEYGSYSRWFGLWLRNDLEGDAVQTVADIELPTLGIEPEGAFVYEPGHNITVKITMPRSVDDDPRLTHERNIEVQSALLKPHKSELSRLRDLPFFSREVQATKYLDEEEKEIELNTATYPTMGWVRLTTGVSRNKTGLVARVENGRTVVLRPSTQAQPFPEGGLYVRHEEWEEINEKGEQVITCRYGDVCQGTCTFVGNDITSLQLYRTENGTTERANFSHVLGVSADDEEYTAMGVFDATSAAGMSQYHCLATNAQGYNRTKTTAVIAGEPSMIVTDKSYMTPSPNKMAGLLVTCTARGRPLPDVTIHCDQSTEASVVYQTDDVISVAQVCRDAESGFIQCDATNIMGNDIFYKWAFFDNIPE